MAAATIRSWLSPRLGPRWGTSCIPHAMATARGSPVSVRSSLRGILAHLPFGPRTAYSVCDIHRLGHARFMSYTDSVLVQLRGLSKSYGTHDGLTDLDLTLPPGIHALLGPNGAGKTTLVNILSTLIPYDSGEVRVLGLDPRRDRTALQG